MNGQGRRTLDRRPQGRPRLLAMTTKLPRNAPKPRIPEDVDAQPAVFSENVVAPVEPVVEEAPEPAEHRFGLRRAPERNVGG